MDITSDVTLKVSPTQTPQYGPGNPVTPEQCQQVFEALEDGQSLREAAALIGVSKQTAWRIVKRYEGSLESARKFLATKALQVSEDWVTASGVANGKGNHLPAKDLLLHIGAIEPLQDASAAKVNIAILIGTPEQPIRVLSPQTIDSKAVTVE